MGGWNLAVMPYCIVKNDCKISSFVILLLISSTTSHTKKGFISWQVKFCNFKMILSNSMNIVNTNRWVENIYSIKERPLYFTPKHDNVLFLERNFAKNYCIKSSLTYKIYSTVLPQTYLLHLLECVNIKKYTLYYMTKCTYWHAIINNDKCF